MSPILLLALVAPTLAAPTPARPLPADVRAVLVRWEGCDHWGGEGPSDDPARQREIDAAVAKLRCTTLERDTAALRRRHAGRADVVDRLKRAEDGGGAE